MKVERKIFKGIEYVELTELPQTQREKLLETLGTDLFIKIMIEGKIVGQCLQYKDYLRWYENIFSPLPAVASKEIRVSEMVEINPTLALNKI